LIDVDEEIRRLEKQITDIAKTIGALEKKLSNPNFIERAPEEVVEKNRGALDEERGREQKLQESLSRLMELKS
jgi:valyl-tRNA synthetase